jgi:hypothetical protein
MQARKSNAFPAIRDAIRKVNILEDSAVLHVDIPTRSEIETLTSVRADPCVSIYLRTSPLTQQAQADRIELKNLIKQAVSQLQDVETAKRSIWPIEEAIDDLIADDEFWAHQANCLAVLATPTRIRTYRLPNHLENMVEVSDRFHIKPLLRAITFPHNAYILCLAEGGVRLVEVTADLPSNQINVPSMPKNASDAIGKASVHDRAQAGKYARAVDKALRPILSGRQRPMILAAAEPLASIFPGVNSYPHLAETVISGNAEHMSDSELGAASREILDGIYAADIAELAEKFAESEGHGRSATDLEHAARAATYGAIDTLIVDMDAVVPGTVSATDGTVTLAKGDSASNYGVVDEIAGRALISGARVLAGRSEDIPGGGQLAAILRYPV